MCSAPGSFSVMKQVMPRWGGSALGSVFISTNTTPSASPLVDPHLLAVELPVAVVELLGRRLDALDVRADLGLRQREGGAQLAGGHARQEVLLLLVGAELDQQVGADEVGVDDARDRDPPARELLDDHRVGRQVEAHPAVLLGNRDAEQPQLLHLIDHGLGELVLVVVLLGDRDDLVVDELAHHLGDRLLLVGLLGESSWLPPSLKAAPVSCGRVDSRVNRERIAAGGSRALEPAQYPRGWRGHEGVRPAQRAAPARAGARARGVAVAHRGVEAQPGHDDVGVAASGRRP